MKLRANMAEHMSTAELQHYLSHDLIEMPSAAQINAHIVVNLEMLTEELERKECRLQEALSEAESLQSLVEDMQEKLERASPRRKPMITGGLRMLVY